MTKMCKNVKTIITTTTCLIENEKQHVKKCWNINNDNGNNIMETKTTYENTKRRKSLIRTLRDSPGIHSARP